MLGSLSASGRCNISARFASRDIEPAVEITEVRIKLVTDVDDRLRAFCSITLKIIEGLRGAFVAMPSRKLTDRCPKCGTKTICGPGIATSVA